MAPEAVELRPPLRGLYDADTRPDQELLHTRDARNVRPRCAFSGLRRLSTRRGLKKLGTGQLDGATRVQMLAPLVYDNPDFLTLSVPLISFSSDWLVDAPTKASVKMGAIDGQENVYIADGGTGIAKLNSKGAVLWKVKLPIADELHQVRALVVDQLSLNVFAGVSSGGSQKTAKLFCVRQLEGDVAEILWEFTTAAYVRKLRIRQSQLYCLLGDDSRNRGFAVVYIGLGSSEPTEIMRREVPHPANDIRVRDDGSFYVQSDVSTIRGLDPLAPGCGPKTVSWRPTHMHEFDARLYSWHLFDQPDGPGGANDYDDGDEILTSFDHGPGERNLYAASDFFVEAFATGKDVVMRPPRWQEIGLGGIPSLNFFGVRPSFLPSTSDPEMEAAGMNSLGQNSVAAEYAASQRAFLPAFKGSQFAMVMLLRPKKSDVDSEPATGVSALGPVWSMGNRAKDYVAAVPAHTQGVEEPFGLWINRESDDTQNAPDPVIDRTKPTHGEVCLYEKTKGSGWEGHSTTGAAGGSPQGEQSSGWLTTNPAGALVVSYIHDGGVKPSGGADDDAVADTVAPTKTRSLWRVNGRQIDRYHSHEFESLVKFCLGYLTDPSTLQDNAGWGAFEACEAIVFQRRRTDAGAFETNEPTVLSHPAGWNTSIAPTQTAYVPATLPADMGGAAVTSTNNELELLEGYMAHRRGVQGALVNTHPWQVNVPPAPGVTTGGQKDPARLHFFGPILAKFNANGDLIWAATDRRDNTDAVVSTDLGGVGYGLAVQGSTVDDVYTPNAGSYLFSVGAEKGADNVDARVIFDFGEKYATSGVANTGAFVISGITVPPDDHQPEMDVDQFDNVYVPWSGVPGFSTNTLKVVHGFKASASSKDYNVAAGAGNVGSYAVAVPATAPAWKKSAPTKLPEFAYLFTANVTLAGTTGQKGVRRIRLTDVAIGTGPPRLLRVFGFANGKAKRFNKGTGLWVSPSATDTIAQPELDAAATHLSHAFIHGELFVSDGKTMVVYNPKIDRVVAYKSKSAGKFLDRPAILFAWRGRLGGARGFDKPQSWHLTAYGDPYDVDIAPPDALQTSSIDGANAPAGEPPEAINAVAPISDDLCLFLCESSVWRMTGDPATPNGQLDFVTDKTGGSFGKSHARDDRGAFYWYGSRGGVWTLGQDAVGLAELTGGVLEKRARQLDLGVFRVEVVWDDVEQGLYVIPVPFGATNTFLISWFWDRATRSWWEDTWPSGKFPTCWALADGDDPNDRQLLCGGPDGFVRYLDAASRDDDGSPIDSYATLGPYHAEEIDQALAIDGYEVTLASDQDGCEAQWFASDVSERAPGGGFTSPTKYPPYDLGPAKHTQALRPGRNVSVRRVCGNYVWLRLRRAASGRWSLERVAANLRPGGARRTRL